MLLQNPRTSLSTDGAFKDMQIIHAQIPTLT